VPPLDLACSLAQTPTGDTGANADTKNFQGGLFVVNLNRLTGRKMLRKQIDTSGKPEEFFMQKSNVLAIIIWLLIVPAVLAADKEDAQGRGWALNAKVGTLGIGADLSRSIIPRVLNLRAGGSFFSYSTDLSTEGIDYSAELKLGAVPIAVDVFPFKNWFRLGGGVIINLNEAHGTGDPSTGTVTIGDGEYTSQDIGQVDAKVKFNRAAPYFGFGFNNPIKRYGHFGFFVDLGFMYHGTPVASMTTTKIVPGLQTEIDKEIQEINEDIKDFKFFPVVQMGLSYRF